MISISQSVIGAVIMVYPVLVQFLLNTFGFRGALAIIAAVNGHAILGMLVMHPVEWHYKIIQIPDEESPCTFEFHYLHFDNIHNQLRSIIIIIFFQL